MPAESMRESMRERLLDATAQVIRTHGLSGTTIREIAAVAGVAEGSVYNHFSGKLDLVSAVAVEHMPVALRDAVHRLSGLVGTGTVRDNLEAFATEAVESYAELMIFASMMVSDVETAASLRQELTRRRLGPGRGHEAVAAYLRIEEENGRVALAVPAVLATTMLMGACHEYAFLRLFSEEPPFGQEVPRFVRHLVAALLAG